MKNNSIGMLPGSQLGLWLAPPPEGDAWTTAQLEGTLAEKNLELASYLGGLPFVIAQDATQDISALHKGKTTLEEIAQQRGIQYVTGALVGKLAQKGLGIAGPLNFDYERYSIAVPLNFDYERSSAEALLPKVSRGIGTLSLLIFQLFCSTANRKRWPTDRPNLQSPRFISTLHEPVLSRKLRSKRGEPVSP